MHQKSTGSLCSCLSGNTAYRGLHAAVVNESISSGVKKAQEAQEQAQ